MSNYIKENAKFNLKLSIALANVNDCQPADLMYHLHCFSAFQRFVTKQSKQKEKIDYALLYVIEELKTRSSKGDVVLLDDVWLRYQDFVNSEYNSELVSSYKDKHTFSICLKNKISDHFEFVNKMSDNETVMFPINYFKEGITSIIMQNETEVEESIIPKHRPESNEFLALVHVALRLRGELKAKKGHKEFSVSEGEAVDCIPEILCLFLSLLFGIWKPSRSFYKVYVMAW